MFFLSCKFLLGTWYLSPSETWYVDKKIFGFSQYECPVICVTALVYPFRHAQGYKQKSQSIFNCERTLKTLTGR